MSDIQLWKKPVLTILSNANIQGGASPLPENSSGFIGS